MERGTIPLFQRVNANIADASDAMQGQKLQIWAALCQCYHCCVCELDAPRQVHLLEGAALCHCCDGFICIHMQACYSHAEEQMLAESRA